MKISTKPKQGHLNQLWAEVFDVEMGSYILSPIDSLNCDFCSGKSGRQTKLMRDLCHFINRIRLRVWLFVIFKIESFYVRSADPRASQIVDHCLGLKEALNEWECR